MNELNLPIVGQFVKQHGKLIEIQDVTPTPVEREVDYIFEKTEAKIEGQIDGKFIKNFGTFHGMFGETDAVANAIKECASLQKDFPSVDFIVTRNVTRTRMRPTNRINLRENFYDKTLVDFDSLSHGSGRGLPADESTVVWSSKKGFCEKDPAQSA